MNGGSYGSFRPEGALVIYCHKCHELGTREIGALVLVVRAS
jgi:hypothetical protein